MSLFESAAVSQKISDSYYPSKPPKQNLNIAEDNKDTASYLGNSSNVKQFLDDIAKYEVLSQPEINELCIQVQTTNDLEARDKVVKHNLKFVVFIANRYRGKGVEYPDLIQEGTLGLIRAIYRYDFQTHQTQFTTYAFFWIRQAIQRVIDNNATTVRKAVSAQALLKLVLRLRAVMYNELGRYPSPEEIAEKGKLDVKSVKLALIQFSERILSLDQLVYQNNDKKFIVAAKIPDNSFLTPDQHLFAIDELNESFGKVKKILECIKKFSTRNQQIFILRFGLDGSWEGKTLEQVGVLFGLCKESIRLITFEICHTLKIRGLISDQDDLIREMNKVKTLIELISE